MPHLEKEDLGADEFTVDILPEDKLDKAPEKVVFTPQERLDAFS